MIVGIIGVGVVGGTLKRWFEKHTSHDIRCLDPKKAMTDCFEGCEAIFISVPVENGERGQDLTTMIAAVEIARQYTDNIFIRSTVLPGTADKLKCIAMPEFLTERMAFEEMERLPILVGKCDANLLDYLFPKKQKIVVSNSEAELAKFTHNCFGAMKVTYFNVINALCERLGADYDRVKHAAFLTGFIEPTHTQVPGPDGYYGFGGKCFPANIDAFKKFLASNFMVSEYKFFDAIDDLNINYRHKEEDFPVVNA